MIRSTRTTPRGATITLCLAGAVLGGLSCGTDDIAEPTRPSATLEAASSEAISPAQVPRYRQVSAGYQHSCGVTPDSLAYCWGYGSFGQLGNGSTASTSRTIAVAGGLKFRQISAGSVTTCGLSAANRAYCWGRAPVGDGTGGGTDRLTPVKVAGGLQFRQVSANGSNFGYACGVTMDYRAYCWGYNDFGQLGIGSHDWPVAPVPVAGGLQFRQLSAGGSSTCGVTLDDRVFCWGYNGLGGLGDGTTTDRSTPVAVAGGLRFRRVSAGGSHTCAETFSNLVYCWGSNV